MIKKIIQHIHNTISVGAVVLNNTINEVALLRVIIIRIAIIAGRIVGFTPRANPKTLKRISFLNRRSPPLEQALKRLVPVAPPPVLSPISSGMVE